MNKITAHHSCWLEQRAESKGAAARDTTLPERLFPNTLGGQQQLQLQDRIGRMDRVEQRLRVALTGPPATSRG
jgi:hypothetical protein